MELKVCDKCRRLTLKTYRVTDYTDAYGEVCSECFLAIVRDTTVQEPALKGEQ
ncbi:MAG: hypothetical protein AABZ39_09125 [Spirochaetota bacterium]